ncbi:MAG: hypothetical protein V3V00_07225 [Saprospiraceae bacterium]
MSDLVSGLAEGALDLENSIEMPTMLFWISKNFAYVTLLFIPISSFATYMSFSGFGRNYIEHIVSNSYIVGQQAIFYSIFILFKQYSNSDYLEIIPVTIFVCYAFCVFWQFFKEGNRIFNIFRSRAKIM